MAIWLTPDLLALNYSSGADSPEGSSSQSSSTRGGGGFFSLIIHDAVVCGDVTMRGNETRERRSIVRYPSPSVVSLKNADGDRQRNSLVLASDLLRRASLPGGGDTPDGNDAVAPIGVWRFALNVPPGAQAAATASEWAMSGLMTADESSCGFDGLLDDGYHGSQRTLPGDPTRRRGRYRTPPTPPLHGANVSVTASVIISRLHNVVVDVPLSFVGGRVAVRQGSYLWSGYQALCVFTQGSLTRAFSLVVEDQVVVNITGDSRDLLQGVAAAADMNVDFPDNVPISVGAVNVIFGTAMNDSRVSIASDVVFDFNAPARVL